LDDASKDSMFSYNKYIKDNKPKSILCLPVLNHDKLYGILYLENATIARAFPPKLVKNLNLLIAQVSISIENAMLNENIAALSKELELSKRKLEKRIKLLELELQSKII
jgi:GAF domain-containing protein